ncbi:MAG: tetratricopeptide repeat protein, partial [Verrucomicrobiota bacterium]
RAESVAWIAERKDVLSGMFFMLTLWAYVRYARQPSRGRHAAVALLFGLGLLCKNMLVTLPFVLLLLDWWPLGRIKRIQNSEFRMQNADSGETGMARISFWGLVREKIPLFLLSAGSCVATACVSEKVTALTHIPALDRFANALVSYVIYVRQMVFPAGLAIPYLFAPGGAPAWKACLAFSLLAAVTALALYCRPKRPYLLLGWLWYLGMLVPVIGLAQISYYAHADRYTYLPEIGLAVAAVWAAADISARWRHRRLFQGALAAAILAPLIIRAHSQTAYWKDGVSLWPQTISRNPANLLALNNYGNALVERGKPDEGIAQLRHALDINPDYFDARKNLGTALFRKGDMEGAIAEYQKAIAINPAADVRNNLGAALFRKGDVDGAIAQYQKALETNPAAADVLNNLGGALFAKGELDQAIAQYQKALRISPENAEARYNLANALVKRGKLEDALAQYRKALDIKPDYAKARYNLGAVLLLKGDFDDAMECFQKTTALSPDPLARWGGLGNAFLQTGDLDIAIVCYRQALKIAPNSADAYGNLGLAFFQKGQAQEARDSWQKSLEIKSDQPSVMVNLAWLLATSRDASLRDGARAVALADQARQLTGGDALTLRTLAAAYAETGNYTLAASAARPALDLAVSQKNDALAAALQKEIQLYQANTPVRDAPR